MQDTQIRGCQVVRVKDGDTFIALIELGFDALRRAPIRLYGYDAPELSQPGGPEAKARAAEILGSGVTLKPRGRSFERWVCEVWVNGVPFANLMPYLVAWTPSRRMQVLHEEFPDV